MPKLPDPHKIGDRIPAHLTTIVLAVLKIATQEVQVQIAIQDPPLLTVAAERTVVGLLQPMEVSDA